MVPVGKKVRIITTANDVIHAFMVPAFGIKQDAIPGFVRDTWFRAEKTGDFYGQCAELCGKEHAYMPIHVKVLSAEDYSAWVADKQKAMAAAADDPSKVWELADLVKRGESVYAANCVACHQANGKGAGTIKPLDGAAVVLDADNNKMISVLAQWPKQRCHACVEAAVGHRAGRRDDLRQEHLVQPDRTDRAARRCGGCAQVSAVRPEIELQRKTK